MPRKADPKTTWYQAYMWCAEIHAGKTSIHIKKNGKTQLDVCYFTSITDFILRKMTYLLTILFSVTLCWHLLMFLSVCNFAESASIICHCTVSLNFLDVCGTKDSECHVVFLPLLPLLTSLALSAARQCSCLLHLGSSFSKIWNALVWILTQLCSFHEDIV